MMLHRMSAYHNRQILCSARLAYSVYYTVGHQKHLPTTSVTMRRNVIPMYSPHKLRTRSGVNS